MNLVQKGRARIARAPTFQHGYPLALGRDEFAHIKRICVGVLTYSLRRIVVARPARIGRHAGNTDDPSIEVRFGGSLHNIIEPMAQPFGHLARHDRLRKKMQRGRAGNLKGFQLYRRRRTTRSLFKRRELVVNGVQPDNRREQS